MSEFAPHEESFFVDQELIQEVDDLARSVMFNFKWVDETDKYGDILKSVTQRSLDWSSDKDSALELCQTISVNNDGADTMGWSLIHRYIEADFNREITYIFTVVPEKERFLAKVYSYQVGETPKRRDLIQDFCKGSDESPELFAPIKDDVNRFIQLLKSAPTSEHSL